MDFLTETSLSQLQFYLKSCFGSVGVSLNQAVPVSLLKKSSVDVFYYYQNQSTKQALANVFIQGDLNALPFLTDSIDVFVLWHNLDTHPDPKLLIAELWRALAPNGVILMVGANNPSLFKRTVEQRQLNNRLQLTRLLVQYGFNIEVQKTIGFRPNIKSKLLFRWLKPMEIIGQFCWPMFGTNYLIQARKPVLGMTPLAAKTKRVPMKPIKGIAAPSTFK